MTEIDFYSIVNSVLGKLAEQTLLKSTSVGAAAVKNAWEKIKVNFAEHLKFSFEKYSVVRTLINRDEAISVNSIYTEITFTSVNEKVKDKDLIAKVLHGDRICITGTGGCGKFMFMKYLLLNLLENENSRIPLLCELRHLNNIDNKDIISFIHYSINKAASDVPIAAMVEFIKEGNFVFIFDGFDEIDVSHRSQVERQIIDFSEKYARNSFVVSSRPDERLSSWSNFRVWHVDPMSLNQMVALITKLKYDKDVKNKFISNVKSHLYAKHVSFLSNPLLATMMLLTYDQFAHVPDKIHLFYEQAFETLFFRHDSSKQAGYQRKMHASLPINEFKNAFSLVCMNTYLREKFSFSDAEMLDFIAQAMKTEGIKCSAGDFLRDLIESICIMQREGLLISFTHRSFQEYFSAHFVSRFASSKISLLLDNLIKRSEDNLAVMAYDMNNALIEREWLLQKIEALHNEIEGINSELYPGEYLLKVFGVLEVTYLDVDRSIQYTVSSQRSEWTNLIFILYRIFSPVFASDKKRLTGDLKQNSSVIEQMRSVKILPKRGFPKTTKIGHRRQSLQIDFKGVQWLSKSEVPDFVSWHKGKIFEIRKIIKENVARKEAVFDLMT